MQTTLTNVEPPPDELLGFPADEMNDEEEEDISADEPELELPEEEDAVADDVNDDDASNDFGSGINTIFRYVVLFVSRAPVLHPPPPDIPYIPRFPGPRKVLSARVALFIQ